MPKAQVPDSADQEIDSNADSGSASEEVETPRKISAGKKISDYERQRLKRIEENKARMLSLGLKKMASSFDNSVPKESKKTSGRKDKGKRKVDGEDEEYMPSEEEEEEEGFGSSSAEDENDCDGGGDDDEDFDLAITKKKAKNKSQTPKKPVSSRKRASKWDFADDDDEALKQAIALSLQDSAGFTDESNIASQSSFTNPIGGTTDARAGNPHIPEDMGKRKRKKSINSRVQMTEDELILHFFQFDEAGHGNINLRDLERMAVAHDFMWSEKEMADMILHFDSDGDGKLSLEDFRKIAGRCNMIQG